MKWWIALVGLLATVAPAVAQFKYVDEQGRTHWVQTPDQVPERYRKDPAQSDSLDGPMIRGTWLPAPADPAKIIRWKFMRSETIVFSPAASLSSPSTSVARHTLNQALSLTECKILLENTLNAEPPQPGSGIRRQPPSHRLYGLLAWRVVPQHPDVHITSWQCVEDEEDPR